jgi:hypothetical protein
MWVALEFIAGLLFCVSLLVPFIVLFCLIDWVLKITHLGGWFALLLFLGMIGNAFYCMWLIGRDVVEHGFSRR